MISFDHKDDKSIALQYAEYFSDSTITKILENGHVNNKYEAYALSRFYWAMIDASQKERDTGVGSFQNMNEHLENIFKAFYTYLDRNGYQEQWNRAIDDV